MEFFTGLGIFVVCLLACSLVFGIILSICKLNNDDDMFFIFVIYSLVLTFLISGLVAIFITNSKDFGYEKITETSEVIELETEMESGEINE